ncbi:hypothetical protein [Planctomyces sp. SH-PL14]|uniref:hypothetical protein n=1 Tax=Planctomyces sp. SH-PL14 TaxID=1632864 RepID=UPI0012E97C47|nr:hypothetical protein [Planctomyces sp. SH-PL14]
MSRMLRSLSVLAVIALVSTGAHAAGPEAFNVFTPQVAASAAPVDFNVFQAPAIAKVAPALPKTVTVATAAPAAGHWEWRKVCNGRGSCFNQLVWVTH